MRRINTHLTEDEIKNLDEITDCIGLKRSDLIRRAVDSFIENYRVFGLTVRGFTGLSETKEVARG